MTNLKDVLEDYTNWVKLELKDARPLEGTYLKAFKNLLGITHEFREIFFNKTSLIVTDIDDYEELDTFDIGLKCTFKMESEQFNINIYVLSFIEHKKLNVLLGGAT